MLHFEFGQDQLAQPQPLNAFELSPIEVTFKACSVAEQVIELRRKRNVLPKRFQFHSLRLLLSQSEFVHAASIQLADARRWPPTRESRKLETGKPQCFLVKC